LQCTNNSPVDASWFLQDVKTSPGQQQKRKEKAAASDISIAKLLACGMHKANPFKSHGEISGRTRNARVAWMKMLEGRLWGVVNVY
jgi:hypothetical protein